MGNQCSLNKLPPKTTNQHTGPKVKDLPIRPMGPQWAPLPAEPADAYSAYLCRIRPIRSKRGKLNSGCEHTIHQFGRVRLNS